MQVDPYSVQAASHFHETLSTANDARNITGSKVKEICKEAKAIFADIAVQKDYKAQCLYEYKDFINKLKGNIAAEREGYLPGLRDENSSALKTIYYSFALACFDFINNWKLKRANAVMEESQKNLDLVGITSYKFRQEEGDIIKGYEAIITNIDGRFSQGVFNGKGRIDYINGGSEEGDFIGNRLEGKGKRIGADGSRYEGEFRGGLPHGIGKLIANDVIYEGTFEKGVFIEGEATYADYKKAKGKFEQGRVVNGMIMRHGGFIEHGIFDYTLNGLEYAFTGILQRPDGARESGAFIKRFEDDRAQLFCRKGQEGTIILRDHTRFQGVIRNGLFKSGISTRSDGAKLEGAFNEWGLEKGRITYPDGTIRVVDHSGEFEGAESWDDLGWKKPI